MFFNTVRFEVTHGAFSNFHTERDDKKKHRGQRGKTHTTHHTRGVQCSCFSFRLFDIMGFFVVIDVFLFLIFVLFFFELFFDVILDFVSVLVFWWYFVCANNTRYVASIL